MTDERHGTPGPQAAPEAIAFDSTGIGGLDLVLGGGIPRGSLVIVAGPPGSGKTILAHQYAFNAARAGRHALILTALSEPTNKLARHMGRFHFFDQDLLGRTIELISAQQLVRQGLDTAADEIVEMGRATNVDLVVLDGFGGVREYAEPRDGMRHFIYDLSNRLNLLGVTLLLTSEAHVRDVTFFPEVTAADVLIGLTHDVIAMREYRTAEVVKARGSVPLTGQHTLTISDQGVTIYPRLETRTGHAADLPAMSAAPAATPSRSTALEVGVPGLDALLPDGLARDTSLLLAGGLGTGKTLFALQYAVAGVAAGESVAFVGFRETMEQLLWKAHAFDGAGTLAEALGSGAFTLLREMPATLRADVLADQLLAVIAARHVRRVVLDGIGEIELALAAAAHGRRFHGFYCALLEALRLRQVSVLITRDAPYATMDELERALGPTAFISETVAWLRLERRGPEPVRALALLQARLAAHSLAWHAVSIAPPQGLRVGGPLRGAALRHLFDEATMDEPESSGPRRSRHASGVPGAAEHDSAAEDGARDME